MTSCNRFFFAAFGVMVIVAPPFPARAVEGLAVGACVTVRDQGPGRIIGLNQGGYVVQPDGAAASEAMNWPRSYVTPGACGGNAGVQQQPAAQQRTCFASDPDSKGANTLEVAFRSDIRRTFERRAPHGTDGNITVSFQSFQIGAPRPWNQIDGLNFTSDTTKPIYILRVTFTTCEDYTRRLVVTRRDSNFECYTTVTGQMACQTSAKTGGMAEDQVQEIVK